MAHAVDGNDRKPVGHGMSALHGDPSLALTHLFVIAVTALPAYEHFGYAHGHETRCLGIPLVPAHEHTETSHTGLNGFKPEVSGSEVKLFIIGRIVRYVHLAILTRDGSVALKDHGCVVIQSCGPALEE